VNLTSIKIYIKLQISVLYKWWQRLKHFKMSNEAELREEIVKLTEKLREYEARSESEPATTATSVTVVESNNVKAKPENYADGSWDEWINHFNLCADVNRWDETQRCQQLAVALRGRAQRIYFTLSREEKADFAGLQAALRSRLQPEEQRRIHKLNFNTRRRSKGENIVDFAASLRQLAQLAYGERDSGFVEEEMIDQFIKALDTRELRVGVSQADAKTLDEAVKIAIKLESIHLAEVQENSTKVNMARNTADGSLAGAKGEDADSAPRWARELMESQTQFMKKMVDCFERKEKKVITCYSCGKPGHIARNCSNTNPNQGNANRAGAQRYN
jgi:hypothetical protein